jgi:molybdenum cofactor biosynthesis protein B
MAHEGHDHDHDDHGHSHEHGHGHSHAHPHAHVRSPAGEHKAAAPAQVSTFVVTCSDTRTEADDESGHLLVHALEDAGHPIAGRRIIRDEPDAIRRALDEAQAAGARAVIFTGGTGIARRDSTIETLQPLFEKELPGFGELFRALSFQEIGSAAMLTRACAGTWKGLVVFALPGSANAARLAVQRLILPELGHLVRELMR